MTQYYLRNDTISLLEPHVKQLCRSDKEDAVALAAISSAISLKRIADLLTGGAELQKTLDMITQHPVNAYGENIWDGIQNSIERGQRGMNTHDRR